MFNGKQVVVKEVVEHPHFYAPHGAYYDYVVQTTDGLETYTASEQSLTEAEKRTNLCECGAWAVHWAKNNHSAWCPMDKLWERL